MVGYTMTTLALGKGQQWWFGFAAPAQYAPQCAPFRGTVVDFLKILYRIIFYYEIFLSVVF